MAELGRRGAATEPKAQPQNGAARQPGEALPSLPMVSAVLCWVAVYYFASSMGSIGNKIVVHDMQLSPALLTLVQSVVSLALDAAAILALSPAATAGPGQRDAFLVTGKTVACGRAVSMVEDGAGLLSTVKSLVPVAMCVLLGRLTTFMSYQTASVSLAHAAKSLEPVINVVISASVFWEFQPLLVNLSLIPVVSGVFMASFGEASYTVGRPAPRAARARSRARVATPPACAGSRRLVAARRKTRCLLRIRRPPLSPPATSLPPRPPQHYGFFLATLSAAFRVLEKIIIKRVMAGRAMGFFQLHFLVGLVSTAAVVSLSALSVLVSGGDAFVEGRLRACSPVAPDGAVASCPVLQRARRAACASVTAGRSEDAAAMAMPVLACACIVHVSSLTCYVVLTMMSHLSFTITNTMKRLSTMAASIAFFGSSATAFNVAGMLLAVTGVLGYNMARAKTRQRAGAAGDSAGDKAAAERQHPDELGLRHEDLSDTDAERAALDETFEGDLARGAEARALLLGSDLSLSGPVITPAGGALADALRLANAPLATAASQHPGPVRRARVRWRADAASARDDGTRGRGSGSRPSNGGSAESAHPLSPARQGSERPAAFAVSVPARTREAATSGPPQGSSRGVSGAGSALLFGHDVEQGLTRADGSRRDDGRVGDDVVRGPSLPSDGVVAGARPRQPAPRQQFSTHAPPPRRRAASPDPDEMLEASLGRLEAELSRVERPTSANRTAAREAARRA
ncbi:TPT, partial [Symbiodinium sp. KB8]